MHDGISEPQTPCSSVFYHLPLGSHNARGPAESLAGLSETEKWEASGLSQGSDVSEFTLPPATITLPVGAPRPGLWATAVSLGEGLTACHELQPLKWPSSLLSKEASVEQAPTAGLPIGKEKPASFPGRKEEKYL